MKNKPLNVQKIVSAIKMINAQYENGEMNIDKEIILSLNDNSIYKLNISFVPSGDNIKEDRNIEAKINSFIHNYIGKRDTETEQFCMKLSGKVKIVLIDIQRKNSNFSFFFKTDDNVIKNKQQKAEEKILNMIKNSEDGGVSLSSITLKTKNLNKIVRKNILKTFIYQNKIEEVIDRSNGRMKRIYRAI